MGRRVSRPLSPAPDGASLDGARLGWTAIVDVDWSLTEALETVEHGAPSGIATSTLERTAAGSAKDASRRGEIEAFLRGAGVSETYLATFGLSIHPVEVPGISQPQAELVAVEVIPKVACPHAERLELLCHAIGAFGSAERVNARFPTAARAVGFALRPAGRHGLRSARASLLQRRPVEVPGISQAWQRPPHRCRSAPSSLAAS